ncbi:MAG: hypothetical protein PHP82_03700 [Candidatus ainarchaeum sp.]|nr:hypothetical protein [Candidatus ainarchaeum sp.]
MENDEINEVDIEKNEDSFDSEEDSNVENDDKLPFPRATITNLIRKNVTSGKQIKGTVKDEMNLWVANLISKIAGKMNSQPYTFVNYDMLKEAIAPYEEIKDINKQREELKKYISKIKEDCNDLITKIDSADKKAAVNLGLEEDKLPFPKATITNKLRSNLDDGKTIKGPVKRGLNIWLGRIVSNISKKMDSFSYPYIDRSMFKEAVEPYDAVSEIELEKERIIQQMQSIVTACDILTSEVERKFKM